MFSEMRKGLVSQLAFFLDDDDRVLAHAVVRDLFAARTVAIDVIEDEVRFREDFHVVVDGGEREAEGLRNLGFGRVFGFAEVFEDALAFLVLQRCRYFSCVPDGHDLWGHVLQIVAWLKTVSVTSIYYYIVNNYLFACNSPKRNYGLSYDSTESFGHSLS